MRHLSFLLVGIFTTLGSIAFAQDEKKLQGITFAESPSDIYVPVRSIAKSLSDQIRYDPETSEVFYNGRKLNQAKILPDGTRLIRVRSLTHLGAQVRWDQESRSALVSKNGAEVSVHLGTKRVEINKETQLLKAYQGEQLIFQADVSSGRRGHRTPNGEFTAGPYKAKMHRSSIYDNAPMPWSVQVVGDIFVHGYSSVPNTPASHGCIRMEIDQAQWFYYWIENGTPIKIGGEWSG